MHYLTEPREIAEAIAQLSQASLLWLDTEVADWQTPYPRLSLIQVLQEGGDRQGHSAYILDVLNQPSLIHQFIQRVMANPRIEKVFHNASYDLRYLGKEAATNVTCTLKLARQQGGKQRLGTSDLKLKTLAVQICGFEQADLEAQQSDWGRRSLSAEQLYYAGMDVVYLAAVHRALLALAQPQPAPQPVEQPVPQPVLQPNATILPEPPMPSASDLSSANQPHRKLSATHLRVSLECPRLFYLGRRFNAKTTFVPPQNTGGVGVRFHELADDLIAQLRDDPEFAALLQAPVEQLDAAEIARQIQQRFYQQRFFAQLQTARQQNEQQVTPLLQIWQGLCGLIQQFAALLVTNRRLYPASTVIQQTFVGGDRKLQHTFTLPDGRLQPIAGEYDCLIFDGHQRRFCVVEFKTYAPVDPAAQLAQVALYSYLLWLRHQAPVDAAVYCVLPSFQTYHYRWDELEPTVHQVIPYKLQQMQHWLTWEDGQPDPPPATPHPDHLCSMCLNKTRCYSLFGAPSPARLIAPMPASSHSPISPSPHPPIPPLAEPQASSSPAHSIIPSPTDPNLLGEQLVATLQDFGIQTSYLGAAVGPAFIRVKLKPQAGVKVNAVVKLSDDLRVQLGLDFPPLIAPQAGYVSVDLPRRDRQTAPLENYITAALMPPTAPMTISIGIDLEGNLEEADLSDPNTCHFLVGGTTGSGKSEFLRSLLLSLLLRHPPSHLQIALVDPKRVTFPEFEQLPWLLAPVVKDGEAAIALMQQLVDEMDSRYRRFELKHCHDLQSYNQRTQDSGHPLPRIVCIFDEYADFMAEKELAKTLEQSIKRLGAMARAAGIHLIIATQRPEARVVTPLIRSNLPGRVALRTASTADSTIVLGGKETSAASLLGKGDLLYLKGGKLLRLQSLWAKTIPNLNPASG
jgi:DNA segregation ATPase FtsK/SpoIIIE, S-DNA-T family